MERNPRSPFACRRLTLALAAALALGGCGGHSNVQFASSGAPATGVSTGGSVSVQGSSTAATLLAIGILAGASYASRYDSYESHYTPDFFSSDPPLRRVPPLDRRRTVNEQDCTRPIESTANLRCR